MIENLARNGSFLERRRVFNELPFHSLNHHSPFDWKQDDHTEQQRRRRLKAQRQQEYVKKMYDLKMEQKLKKVYNNKVDTFRAIPNELTAQKDQQALAKQLQQFEHAKQQNTNPEHIEPSEQINSPFRTQRHSAMELNNKSQLKELYPRQPTENQAELGSSRINYSLQQGHSTSSSRRYSPEQYNQIYRLPYLSRNNYGPSSIPNYRKYANLSNSKDISIDHPMRNYLPDQLEGHLRYQSKVQERRPMRASLLMKERMKY